MWWFIFALGLEPICFGFNCTQVGSSSMFMELFCLHVISPRLHFWPSHLFFLGKSFHLLKTFLPSTKRWGVVQSVFEFKKSSTFCCCQKCSNHFWKLRNIAGIILHILCILNLVIIFEKPQVPFLFLLNGKGFQGLSFSLFFSFF